MVMQAPGRDTPLRIVESHVMGEDIVLGAGAACDVISDSTIEDCRIAILNSRALIVVGSRFVNCEVRPKRQVQTTWNGAAWDGCTFRGRYLSTHFGIAKDESGPASALDVLVRDCDSSRATLHGCVFMRTDVQSTVFPRWPCFAVLQAQRNRMAWKTVPAPVPGADFFNRFDSRDERSFSDAEVFHWPTVVKFYRETYRKYRSEAARVVAESDPEEIKRILSTLDFVRL
jgi:hypothetical protein